MFRIKHVLVIALLGLVSMSFSQSNVNVENVSPIIDITSVNPGTSVITTDTISFNWLGADTDGEVVKYHYQLNERDIVDCTYTAIMFAELDNGEYTFRVKAEDDAGAFSNWESHVFTVNAPPENQKPVIDIVEGPENGSTYSDNYVTFRWEAGDEDGDVMYYAYIFDNGDELNTDINTVSFDNLENGVHSFKVKARDNLDAWSDWDMVTFTVDVHENEPPTVAIVEGPENGSTIETNSVSFRWEGDDPDGQVWYYKYQLDDGSVTLTEASTKTFEELENGEHTFKVKAFDNEDADSEWDTVTFTVNVPENQPPTVDILEGPENGSTIDFNDVPFHWEGTDVDGEIAYYKYQLDDGDVVQTEAFTKTFNDLENGEHTFKVKAFDNDGADSEWETVSFIVNVQENQPPVVEITDGPENGFTVDSHEVTFKWSGSDADGEVVKYFFQINGHEEDLNDTTFTFQHLENGSHTFKVKAKDNDGAFSEWDQVSFTVNVPNQPPVVEIVDGPENGATIVVPYVTFRWEGSDSDGQVWHYKYQLDDGNLTQTEASSKTFDGLQNGEHTFKVKAFDNEGADSEWDAVTFTVNVSQNQPPVVEIVEGPENGSIYSDDYVTFRWEGSDPDGSLLGYQYKFDDEEQHFTEGTTASFDNLENGSHTFKVRAIDNVEAFSEWDIVTFTVDIPNQPPTIEITSGPENGATIEIRTVTFAWAGNDPDGEIYKYIYKMDNGSETWTEATTKTFEGLSNGEHTFKVKSKDNRHTYSEWASVTFTVNAEGGQNQPPVVEMIDGPENGDTIENDFVTFHWEGGDPDGEIVKYYYQLDNRAEQWTEDISVTFFDLENGEHHFKLKAKDNDHAYSQWLEVTFHVNAENPDNIPPVLEITEGPEDGATIRQNFVKFEWEGEDEDGEIVQYVVQLDDRDKMYTMRTSKTFENLENGEHHFQVICKDNDGAFSGTHKVDFIVDVPENQPPVVDLITGPEEDAVLDTNIVTFSWLGRDEDGQVIAYQYQLNGRDKVTTQDTTVTFDNLEPGEQMFKVRSIDNVEAFSAWDERHFFIRVPENIPPVVEITDGPEEDAVVDTNVVTFTWRGRDEDGHLLGYQYMLNGRDKVTTGDTTATFDNLEAGEHVFKVRSIDNVEDYSEWAERHFTIRVPENIPPVVEITGGPEEDAVLDTNVVTFTWKGEDEDGHLLGYQYMLNGREKQTTNDTTATFENLDAGEHVFKVRSIDNVEAYSEWAERHFTVQLPENIPPTIQITGGPEEGATVFNGGVTFNWQGSDKDGTIRKYYYQMDDGEVGATNDTTKTFRELADGEHTFHVQCVDNNGGESDWLTRNFVVESMTTLQFNGLTFNADRIEPLSDVSYMVDGNVNINNILFFNNEIVVDLSTMTIKGTGKIFVKNIPGVPDAKIYDGYFEFSINPDNNQLAAISLALESFVFKIGHFKLVVDKITLAETGVDIDGYLLLPKELGFERVAIHDILFSPETGLTFPKELNIGTIKLHDTAELRDVILTFDPTEESFTGHGYLHTQLFNIFAELEFQAGTLNNIKVRLLSDLPLGYTGYTIASATGYIKGILHPPVSIKLNVELMQTLDNGFTAVEFGTLEAHYTFGKELKCWGDVSLFGNELERTNVNIFPDRIIFSGKTEYDMLAGCVEGMVFQNDAQRLNVVGQLTGTLTIPDEDGFPFDLLRSVVDLPYNVPNTSNYIVNEGIKGAVTLFDIPISYDMVWDGATLSANFAQNLSSLSGSGLLAAQNGIQSVSSTNSFAISSGTSLIIVRGTGNGMTSSLSLVQPNGTLVDEAKAAANSNISFYKNNGEQKAFYVIKNPQAGEWSIQHNADGNALIDIFGANVAPTIHAENLYISGSTVDISWTAEDPDNNASVSLYYDDNNAGFNGTPIAYGLQEDGAVDSYSWNIDHLETGVYYVYATISDGINSPVNTYFKTPVNVISTTAPKTPENLTFSLNDTTVALQWQDSGENVSYMVYYSDTDDLGYNSTSYNVGDSTFFEFNNFVPGKKYRVAVTAVDAAFNQSGFSNIVEFQFTSLTQNNAPTILTKNVTTEAIVNLQYQQVIQAVDPDDDELTYELTERPAGMSISGSGVLQWTPQLDQIGDNFVSLLISDEQGLQDSTSFTITVLDSLSSTGKLAFNKAVYSDFGELGVLTLVDPNLNKIQTQVDSFIVRLYSLSQPSGMNVMVYENQPNSGQFAASFAFSSETQHLVQITVNSGDSLWATYADEFPQNTIVASSFFISENQTGVKDDVEQVTDYFLSNSYPNPFNATTVFQFSLPEQAHTQISVYNALGEKIATLLDEEKPKGNHLVKWSGQNDFGQLVSTGVYFIRFESRGSKEMTFTRKVLMIK